MLTQTEAQIYLESRRGISQSEGFRSFHTFNTNIYQKEGREAIGSFIAFDDQTLAPEAGCVIEVEEPTEIILIPLVGGIELVADSEEANYINSGETFHFLAKPEKKYQIVNPYPEATINYLQIRFKSDILQEEIHSKQNQHTIFDISQKNILLPVFNTFNKNTSAYIGKYGGREEGVYTIQNPENCIFVFIIEGAFEVQDRLLEKRDGLSLMNVETVDFEALSNDAVVLVMEVGM
ncbi:hypothetical protein [Dyadobacter sp. NIV53]|uniref:pirin family protein n=1 Tax=Dyadobacter sp. NIV53 TaxID=2861765 RepID=UPI001C8560EF|nr:hypothetical protein [Dyadobacter sp. NIV53]